VDKTQGTVGCYILFYRTNVTSSAFSQPVGTTGVESRNVYWVFGFRRVNRALRLDPHSFNARSKRDLPRF
jgi:hypothetical protein